MKGGLSVSEPSGERWDLALDLIERGEEFVLLGGTIQLARHTNGPSADGLVHIAVLAGRNHSPPVAIAERQVDAARKLITHLASQDSRFQKLLEEFGTTWEYVADDGSASWLVAKITADGALLWPSP